MRKYEQALTIPKFLEWVKKQNPDETYDYMDCRGCPIYNFLRDTAVPGAEGLVVGGFTFTTCDIVNNERVNHQIYIIPNKLSHNILASVDKYGLIAYRTYGQLVERLEQIA